MADEHKEEVVIFIDDKEKRSPNPTTGHALYVLGCVNSQTYDLFRETHGKGDDELIPDSDAPIKLKEGERFFSLKKKLKPGT
jgi:hypothetical protein